MRLWWNWQTRYFEGVVLVRAYEFKSRQPHHIEITSVVARRHFCFTKITPAKFGRGFNILRRDLERSRDFDKAKCVFDFADVQALNEVVHFLREGSRFAVADNVILAFVAQDANR